MRTTRRAVETQAAEPHPRDSEACGAKILHLLQAPGMLLVPQQYLE